MKTILFDLDGTLLPMDVKKFMHLYSQALNDAFIELEPDGQMFKKVMNSVQHTVMNSERYKNFDKFFNHFQKQVDGDLNLYLDKFDYFYDHTFEKVKPSTYVSEAMIKSVDVLKSKGYRLIIATNPIFPMKANLKRIEWAGLNPNDFDYISNFEENHFCKPHLSFYEEILQMNNLSVKDVLMVGNDVVEDLAIRAMGVETFLINNHIIGGNHYYETEYQGDYNDFLEFSMSLGHPKEGQK